MNVSSGAPEPAIELNTGPGDEVSWGGTPIGSVEDSPPRSPSTSTSMPRLLPVLLGVGWVGEVDSPSRSVVTVPATGSWA